MTETTLRQFVNILRCPVSYESLTELSGHELRKINDSVAKGERLHRDGEAVQGTLRFALGTPARSHVYRVEDGIAWLLPDMAIVRPDQSGISVQSKEKRVVQGFYDDFGWKKSDAGLHNDTVQFTDTRELSQSYRRHCNARISHLLTGGVVLVDAACGAIPHPEYLNFSTGYKVRVCVDFSIRALREAQQKLGDRGIYLLGDITHLPLNDKAADDVISLHTIYHLPKAEQSAAIDELSRVTKHGGRTIVVYVWASSFLMNCSAAMTMFLGKCRRLVARRRQENGPPDGRRSTVDDSPNLFFCPQDHAWFAREVMPRRRTSLRVWSAVDVRFQNRFFSSTLLGRVILRVVVAFEDYCPSLAGRIGQYPMFILEAAPVGPTRPSIRAKSC